MPRPHGDVMDDLVTQDLADTRAWPCFASTSPGLEIWALRELQAIGLQAHEEEGGVAFEVPLDALPALLRRLRVPSRLLVRMGEGRVDDPAAVKALLDRVPWRLLPATPPRVALRLSAHGAAPDRIRWLQVELLRQLAVRFGNDRVTTLAPTGEAGELTLAVRLQGRVAQVSADAGGSPLHMRGYRLEAGPAPLRETYAAALLHAAGYDGVTPLWDPMTGSGTIAIEAALWGRSMAWELRRFAVDDWRIGGRMPTVQHPQGPRVIVAGDLDAEVLGIARRNAERAGVADQIVWQHAEMAAQQPPQDVPGIVVANPPYGKRLGGRNAARRLYERFGAVLARRCPGWRVAILAPERELVDRLPVLRPELQQLELGGLTVWLITGTVAGSHVLRTSAAGRRRRA